MSVLPSANRLLACVAAVCLVAGSLAEAGAEDPAVRPNVLLILVDDLG